MKWPKTKQGRIRLIVWSILLVVLAIYVFGGFLERRTLFFPYKTLEGSPKQIGLKFEDVTLTTTDGVALHAWFVPHPTARATLLVSHGNAGNISYRLEKLAIFNDLGVNVLMYDYRGYGQSKGSPNEDGLYADAQAAYDWLTKQKKIPAKQIIAYGESLGGAVSAHLARHNEVGGLILDSAFTSVPDMARAHYAILAWATRMKFDTHENVKHARAPVLVLHSPNDEIVPFEQGKRLFAAAPEPKQFVELRSDHNGGFLISGDIYVEGLRKFLDAHFLTAKP